MAEHLTGVWVLAHYRAGVRDLLRALKYRRKMAVLDDLRTILAAGEEVLEELPPSILAVPVPLAPQRQKERGFNQTEAIFAPWFAAHGIPFEPILIRTRETMPSMVQMCRGRISCSWTIS